MQMRRPALLRKIADIYSSSFLLRNGQRLWERNSKDWNLPLSKWNKLSCGTYLILRDFAAGNFPPEFKDQAEAYRNEIEYDVSLPGIDPAEVQRSGATKPFWVAPATVKYLGHFSRAFSILQKYEINSGQRLLELGCGPGWMAEFFALAGYSVVGTTISPRDIELANKKAAALRCKGIDSKLEFRTCPMESVDEVVEFRAGFEAAYIYEALHHAFDWRRTLRAAAATLKPRGWLLVASEPNRIHTFVSYRVARLSRTHEIGFRKSELVRELHEAGFGRVDVLQPRFDNWISHFWIMARKE